MMNVERLITYLDENSEMPSLEMLAGESDLSLSQLHQGFQNWIGMSPKDFLKGLSHAHIQQSLQRSKGHFHNSNLTLKPISEGIVKSKGRGLCFQYGSALSPFGRCFCAKTEQGLCRFHFIKETEKEAEYDLFEKWSRAEFRRDDHFVSRLVKQIFQTHDSHFGHVQFGHIQLWIRASSFQFQVLKSLLHLPRGELVSYRQIGNWIGKSAASRAIGAALRSNPIAVIIPCHRVVGSSGEIKNYRWGRGRKRALIAWESRS